MKEGQDLHVVYNHLQIFSLGQFFVVQFMENHHIHGDFFHGGGIVFMKVQFVLHNKVLNKVLTATQNRKSNLCKNKALL